MSSRSRKHHDAAATRSRAASMIKAALLTLALAALPPLTSCAGKAETQQTAQASQPQQATQQQSAQVLQTASPRQTHVLRVCADPNNLHFSNAPPAHALTNRHIIGNVRGYTLYGDYSKPNPPADIVAAVARGEVDVAVVWGPLAGYFAPKQKVSLAVVPVSPQVDQPFLPFVYDIAMGVRRGDNAFRDEVEDVLERRRDEVERILDEYGVPRVGASDSAGADGPSVAAKASRGGA